MFLTIDEVIMEFSLDAGLAQRAIKLLGVTAKQNTSDFEGQILIKALDDEVLFISNNGDSGISCRFPATVTNPGQLTVIFSKIKTFIMTFAPWDGECGIKDFIFVLDGNRLNISAEIYNPNDHITKANLKLETQKPSTFIGEVLPQAPNLILNSNIIKSAVEKSLYAIDNSSLQDFVRGLRVFVSSGEIKFTSTNGSVVSDYSVKNDSSLQDGEYFLSYDFLSGLRRLSVDDVQWFFELSRAKNILSFDNIVYWAKSSMYKEYPRYQDVFNFFDKTIVIDRDTILSGLSSMEDAWTTDDHNRLTLGLKEGNFILQTDHSLFECPGMDDAITFNVDVDGKDLLNTFRSMSDAFITLKLSEETRGIIAESKGFEDHRAFLVCLTRR